MRIRILTVATALADQFGLGLGGNYVSDSFANPGNTVTLPSCVMIDALAWVKIGK